MLLVAGGLAAAAQSIEDFDEWMRTIDEKTQAVQQALAQKDAQVAAKTLQAHFALVERFWAARDDGKEAVRLSREAREHAEAIANAVAMKDFARAQSESIKMADTRTPCHRLHRSLF